MWTYLGAAVPAHCHQLPFAFDVLERSSVTDAAIQFTALGPYSLNGVAIIT
jgi:hypothetical protein